MVESLAEELLEQAKHLLTLPPNQANLRRAVSAAYYSLFHLLVRSTALKWTDPLHRARIGRIFEHRRMKEVCAATIKSAGSEIGAKAPSSKEDLQLQDLKKVAQTFISLQQARHEADYNLDGPLDSVDAQAQVNLAQSAFEAWRTANDSEAAKEFLFLLLFREKERG
jgi:hypothetical protein